MRGSALLLLAVLLGGCAVPASEREPVSTLAASCTDLLPLPSLPPEKDAPLPSLAAPARPTVERDADGVPVIRGETTVEIWRGIGVAMAEDRLWQLEVKRLARQGRLAELHGPEALEADMLARLHRPSPGTLAALHAELEPDTRAALDAYVAGINDVLLDPTRAPAEMLAYGWTPAPWTALDVVDIMVASAPLGVESFALPLFYALDDALGEGARAAFDDVVPAGDPEMPTSIPSSELRYASRDRPAWADAHLDALRDARPVFEGSAGATLRAGFYGEPRGGSNAIVVSPRLSATGGALLLGGPQVGYETPAVYWEAQVDSHGETWNIFIKPGEALPRGRIGAAAFVLTTGYADQHDLVLLELDPSDPERYRYGGETRPFVTRTEVLLATPRPRAPVPPAPTVPPALPSPPETPDARVVTMRASHLGPVVAYDAAAGWAVAQQSFSPRGQLGHLDVLLDEALPAEAADAVAMRGRLSSLQGRVDESSNLLAAFRDGGIALYHLGAVPERVADVDRRLPRLGDPASEPTGVWGPSCLPRIEDPVQGWIANWNNAPAQGWPHMAPRPWMWGAGHRVQPLMAELERAIEEGPLTLERLDGVNAAAAWRDLNAEGLVRELGGVIAEPRLAPIAEWAAAGAPMRDADGDGTADDAGLAAYEAWRAAAQDAVFGDELGAANKELAWGEDLVGANYDDHGISFWTEGAMLRLLRGAAAHDWWDDVRTPERETPAQALAPTWDGLPGMAGPLPRIHFRPTGLAPALSMPQMNRGSVNYLVDLGSGETWTIVPPGQSGHIGPLGPSPHMADQLDRFAAFEYKVYR